MSRPRSPWKPHPLVVIAAPGPSLNEADLKAAKAKPLLCVGDAYRLAPWADAIYHADYDWWAATPTDGPLPHHEAALYTGGIRYTQSHAAAEAFGLECIPCKRLPGFGAECLHSGGNSGFQAINLAILMGAEKIVLTGFDYGSTDKKHFFGDHPGSLNRPHAYAAWLVYLRDACKRSPVPIINASRETAIDFLPRMTMDQALCSP